MPSSLTKHLLTLRLCGWLKSKVAHFKRQNEKSYGLEVLKKLKWSGRSGLKTRRHERKAGGIVID